MEDIKYEDFDYSKFTIEGKLIQWWIYFTNPEGKNIGIKPNGDIYIDNKLSDNDEEIVAILRAIAVNTFKSRPSNV